MVDEKIYDSRKNYMVVSHEKKFVYFKTQKCGSSTIQAILSDYAKLSEFFFPFIPKLYTDYFLFAFVRNPWDRVVSCYFSKVATKSHEPFKECFGKDFEAFVDFVDRKDLKKADRHIRLQTSLIPVDHLDFIGRFENFEEDLKEVLTVIDIQNISIPQRNVTEHEHYRRYYNDHTKEVIARKYQKDIEAFGYEF